MSRQPDWKAGENPSQADLDMLFLGAVYAAGEGGLPNEHLEAVADWADDVVKRSTLLCLAFRGEVLIGWNPTAKDVTFRLTESGKAHAEEVLARLRKGTSDGA